MISNIVFSLLTVLAMPAQQASCIKLQELSFPNATVQSAELVAAGPYTVRRRSLESSVELPAHCRVAIVLTPSLDSHIEMALWLPVQGWNGKFLAVGNGGWAGSIVYSSMVSGLKEGYATASNDTGHKGANAAFALGHHEKVVDFAYRAMHEMAVQSKALIGEFYEEDLRFSYFQGCSTGGRQALMAAQRYPADFDAIIAGAPANPQIEKHAGDIQRNIEMQRRGAEILPAEKVELAYQTAVSTCDVKDGVEDGLVSDPGACSFDPGVLLCKDKDKDVACLSPGQVETLRIGYAPMVSGSGQLVYDAYVPATERSWSFISNAEPRATALGTYRYVVYQDSNWDWTGFDIDRDLAKGRELASYINATPDLRKFKARGGKLLLYHGWSDGNIVPHNTINYYKSVLNTMGEDQDDWMSLFMVPGMAHCGGGDGPNQIHWLSALERWREKDEAPQSIIAHRVKDNRLDMTRPLCPYPKLAQWTGTGSVNDAANFTCELP